MPARGLLLFLVPNTRHLLLFLFSFYLPQQRNGAHFLLSGRVVTATVVVASSSNSATWGKLPIDNEENKRASPPVLVV